MAGLIKNFSNSMKNYKNRNEYIIFSFLILSVLSIFIMALSGKATAMGDTNFHWQRILELKNGIEHFSFPRLAFSNFNYAGSAVMTMYPYITLFPYAIASIFIKSIIGLVYFMFAFYIFTALLISFYASKGIIKDDLSRYLFAIIYGMIGNFELNNTDFGVNIVIIVLPLAFFGIISFVKEGKWIELSAGMSLILFSNILAFIITSSFVLLFLILNHKSINKSKMMNLIKAILLTLITTAVFWIPFLRIALSNDLQIPKMFVFPDIMDKIQHSTNITQYVSNNIGMNINYVATFTMFFGLFFIFKMSKMIRQLYLIGTLLFLFYSLGFIWQIISNVPILKLATIIQFPTRFYFISQIILDFVFTMIVTKYVNYNSVKSKIKAISLIIGFVILSQMAMQWSFYNENMSNGEQYIITKQNEYQYINTTYDGHPDYYPNSSLPMANYLQMQLAIYDVNKTIKTFPDGNGTMTLSVPVKNIYELNLPILYYNSVNYQVIMDGKVIPSHPNKTSLITINNVPGGKHTIQIIANDSFYDFISVMISIMGLLSYAYFGYERLKDKDNN